MVTPLNPFTSQADEDKNKDQLTVGQPVQTSTGNQGATVGSTPAPATPSTSTSTGTGPKTSSGRYTNLAAFVNANKGFNQGQGLAGKVAGNIQNMASQQGQQLQNVQQQFGKQSAEGSSQFTAPAAPVTPGQPAAQPNSVESAQQYTQQLLSNPVQAKAEDQQKFGGLLNAEYKGPQGLDQTQGGGSLSSNLQGLQNTAKQTQTEPGRFNLLRQMFGNSNYSRGQQSLDNLLMNSNKDQVKQLQGTQAAAGQATAQYQQAQKAAADQAANLTQQAGQIQQATRGALGQNIQQFDAAQAQRAQEAQNARAGEVARAQAAAKEGKLDPNLLTNMKLQGQNLYDLNLGDYLTPSTLAATKQNVGNAADYAKISALQNLAGGGNYSDDNISKIFADYANPDQAGKFQAAGPYSVDAAKLREAATSRGNLMNEQVKAIYDKQKQFEQDRQNSLNRGDVELTRADGTTSTVASRAAKADADAQKIRDLFKSGRSIQGIDQGTEYAPAPIASDNGRYPNLGGLFKT